VNFVCEDLFYYFYYYNNHSSISCIFRSYGFTIIWHKYNSLNYFVSQLLYTSKSSFVNYNYYKIFSLNFACRFSNYQNFKWQAKRYFYYLKIRITLKLFLFRYRWLFYVSIFRVIRTYIYYIFSKRTCLFPNKFINMLVLFQWTKIICVKIDLN